MIHAVPDDDAVDLIESLEPAAAATILEQKTSDASGRSRSRSIDQTRNEQREDRFVPVRGCIFHFSSEIKKAEMLICSLPPAAEA